MSEDNTGVSYVEGREREVEGEKRESLMERERETESKCRRERVWKEREREFIYEDYLLRCYKFVYNIYRY